MGAISNVYYSLVNVGLQDEATVDMALLLLGTMNHLQTHDQAQCCLDAAYVALKPGGLLLIELQHPHDLFDGSFIKGDFWEADLEADKQVILEYGTDDDWFDPVQQVTTFRGYSCLETSSGTPGHRGKCHACKVEAVAASA